MTEICSIDICSVPAICRFTLLPYRREPPGLSDDPERPGVARRHCPGVGLPDPSSAAHAGRTGTGPGRIADRGRH